MTRRFAFALLAALALLLVAAQGASAASSAQIHRDAGDGVIDGNYTIAELRAADRTAPAELREYFGWDDAYQDALRRKANPDAPPTVAPVDSDRDGKIEPEERAAAAEKTKEVRAKAKKKQAAAASECADDEEAPECPDSEADECDDEADEDECVDADEDVVNAADSDDGDDSGSALIWLIVGLPVLVVAVGAWRMQRRRKGSTKGSDAA